MKVLIAILLSLAITSANVVHNLRQPKEIAQRRQIIGYSNNIIHEDANYPDQGAQSSVNVNFNSHPDEVRKQIYRVNNNQYQQEILPAYTQNYPTSAPQSQLFNVGYSVSFTNGNKPPKSPPKYARVNNLDNGEIITGTRKQNEEVQIPSINMTPQEYVSAALISTKKQKLSGIKPKPQLVTNYQSPKVLLTQANLSPNTQKYFKSLQELKPQVQNTQELQQKYSWRNLSPGVEIIRSTEIPISQKYTSSRTEPLHFDHARALGRSQEFDYTNAIDTNNSPPQNGLFYNTVRKAQPEQTQQIPVTSQNTQTQIQNMPQYPIDASLLREPVSVQVDTRYLDEDMRQQFLAKFRQNQEPVQEVNYSNQAYRTIPVEENAEPKPVHVSYRQEPQALQENILPKPVHVSYRQEPQALHENTLPKAVQVSYRQEAQTLEDYQPEQNRYQYKIYGKPQPIPGPFSDGPQESFKRQPRYLTDLHTNLRPPPFDLAYQRRIRVG